MSTAPRSSPPAVARPRGPLTLAGPRPRAGRRAAPAGLPGRRLLLPGRRRAPEADARAREPIDELLADPDTDPELAAKLSILTEARRFAIEALALPDTDSYRSYAATGRRHVTWNVVAAEEFSVAPHTWCFPVAGCVSYRGYYAEGDARAYADGFAALGYDVTVGGASAYSHASGWFDDPVLDTMLRGGQTRWVGTLFHEMGPPEALRPGRQRPSTRAYATFVERQGVREWAGLGRPGRGRRRLRGRARAPRGVLGPLGRDPRVARRALRQRARRGGDARCEAGRVRRHAGRTTRR